MLVDDDGQDLAAQRQPILLEVRATDAFGAPDHGDFAIAEVETEEQR